VTRGPTTPSIVPIDRPRFGSDGTSTISNQSFASHEIYEIDGSSLTFEACDFSSSVIERSYFKGAKFVRCKFIGTRFIDANFRSCEFDRCDFRYATFITGPVAG
jgi:uncharacterized protein YjbI with pentapeptide repeats